MDLTEVKKDRGTLFVKGLYNNSKLQNRCLKEEGSGERD